MKSKTLSVNILLFDVLD